MESPQPVDDGLFAGVEIVELGLGDRVVDVHSRHRQFARLGQLVQPVHARHALLHDACATESCQVAGRNELGKEIRYDSRDAPGNPLGVHWVHSRAGYTHKAK